MTNAFSKVMYCHSVMTWHDCRRPVATTNYNRASPWSRKISTMCPQSGAGRRERRLTGGPPDS